MAAAVGGGALMVVGLVAVIVAAYQHIQVMLGAPVQAAYMYARGSKRNSLCLLHKRMRHLGGSSPQAAVCVRSRSAAPSPSPPLMTAGQRSKP